MGILLSRIRPEPYYKSCDKYLERLENKCSNLEVHNKAEELYTPGQAATRVSVVFVPPVIIYCLTKSLALVTSILDRWDKKRLGKLQKSKIGLLTELKDSSHYNKVMDLMLKYDPEERKKADLLDIARKQQVVERRWSNQEQPIRAAPAPGQTLLQSTGKVLMPVLDKLANSVIGDNPALLDELSALHRTLGEVNVHNERLVRENSQLKEELMKLQPDDSCPGTDGSENQDDTPDQHDECETKSHPKESPESE